MRHHLFGEAEHHQETKVIASSLNIRSGPGVEYEKLDETLPHTKSSTVLYLSKIKGIIITDYIFSLFILFPRVF